MINLDQSNMIREANCRNCDSKDFILMYRVGIVSPLAPGNTTGKEGFVLKELLTCVKCGAPAPVYPIIASPGFTPTDEQAVAEKAEEKVVPLVDLKDVRIN